MEKSFFDWKKVFFDWQPRKNLNPERPGTSITIAVIIVIAISKKSSNSSSRSRNALLVSPRRLPEDFGPGLAGQEPPRLLARRDFHRLLKVL